MRLEYMDNCFQIIETGLLVIVHSHRSYIASPYLFYSFPIISYSYIERRYPTISSPEAACIQHNTECEEMYVELKSIYEIRI